MKNKEVFKKEGDEGVMKGCDKGHVHAFISGMQKFCILLQIYNKFFVKHASEKQPDSFSNHCDEFFH